MKWLGHVVAAAVVTSAPVGGGIGTVVLISGGSWALSTIRNRLSRKKAEGKSQNGVEDNPEDNNDIYFANIQCSIEGKESVKKALKNGCGEAHPGRLLAVLGPSGSGKSTLLQAIAGKIPAKKNIKLKGIVLGKHVTESCLIPQEDCFYSQLTVLETLQMGANLQLPKLSKEEKDQKVQEMLKELSLSECANTPVGDKKTRGISGGEKKRLSIGLELLSNPSIIIADEPTTGLDSFQAQKVMKVLKALANNGRTVICSIHQPSSAIFALFDDLILLSSGETVYSGKCSDAVKKFKEAGLECPTQSNPAEFLVDSISVDHTSEEEERECYNRMEKLKKTLNTHMDDLANKIVAKAKAFQKKGGHQDCSRDIGVKSSIWMQVKLLFFRSFRQVTRDKATNMIRAMTNINSAIVFGSIYWRLKRSQTTIQDRMGLLQVAAINTAMSSITKTLTAFTKERIVVNRERAKASYAVGPYFVSKLAAELPISAFFPLIFGTIVYPMCGLNWNLKRFARFLSLVTVESFTSSAIGLSVGSMVPSSEAATALGPAVMVIFIVFGGYYCNEENVPVHLRWIPRVSLIRHGFEGLCVNEFRGMSFETDQPNDLATGDQVLERLGFGNSTVGKSAISLGRILLFNYYLTYITLKKNKPKFQQMEVAI